MFDGDGCICIRHDHRNSRGYLSLDIPHTTSPKLLEAIQICYPGDMKHNPPRLLWRSAATIPLVFIALSQHLVMQKQKLDTLL